MAGWIGKTVRVRTTGGGDFRGELRGFDQDRIEIVDGEGRIVAIARETVASAVLIEGGGISFEDAAENRLIIMPTAFGMDPGEFHVTYTEIVLVTGSYGLSRYFTLWGGVSVPGAMLNAKASLPLGGFGAVAVGSFAGYFWLFDDLLCIIPYGMATIGTPERHFDLGGGAVITGGGALEWTTTPVASIGGKIPFSRTAAFVTETWVIFNQDLGGGIAIFPAAVLRIASSRFSWDLGAAFPIAYSYETRSIVGLFDDYIIPVPIVSFTYRIR
jgi:hypothetical protein